MERCKNKRLLHRTWTGKLKGVVYLKILMAFLNRRFLNQQSSKDYSCKDVTTWVSKQILLTFKSNDLVYAVPRSGTYLPRITRETCTAKYHWPSGSQPGCRELEPRMPLIVTIPSSFYILNHLGGTPDLFNTKYWYHEQKKRLGNTVMDNGMRPHKDLRQDCQLIE